MQATRELEARALAVHPHMTLMNRAGRAVARLALALVRPGTPVLVVTGPGNNGGDGWVAARHLHTAGLAVRVWEVQAAQAADAVRARADALQTGVGVLSAPPWPIESPFPTRSDLLKQHGLLVIDALLGVGAREPLPAPICQAMAWIHEAYLRAPHTVVLSVDMPSGLNADTGAGMRSAAGAPCLVQAHHSLSLLTLKPGLFTHEGREASGQVWFDDLGTEPGAASVAHTACLVPSSLLWRLRAARVQPHGAPQQGGHKGTHGDVWLLGGAPGMRGALLLASRAAVAAGGGRVHRVELSPDGGRPDGAAHTPALVEPHPAVDEGAPEVMTRTWAALSRALGTTMPVVVAGCGGGQNIAKHLPELLHRASCLVLDADALNALAADTSLWERLRSRAAHGLLTVLTPHPLEAARLLKCSTTDIQTDRLRAAQMLAERSGATVVLKGAGSIVATSGRVPWLNDSGNARLATGGTGDVLAGWIGGAWAGLVAAPGRCALSAAEAFASDSAALHDLVAACIHLHGLAAERADGTGAHRPVGADQSATSRPITLITGTLVDRCDTAVLPASALIGEMARELMRTAHGHQG